MKKLFFGLIFFILILLNFANAEFFSYTVTATGFSEGKIWSGYGSNAGYCTISCNFSIPISIPADATNLRFTVIDTSRNPDVTIFFETTNATTTHFKEDKIIITIKDSDEDGVSDSKDNCPDIPEGAFGINGCPDSDQDRDPYPSDCNDNDAAVNKFAAEICDGIDNNCNDEIDEVCDCVHGETRNCGSPIGICTQGIQTCNYGTWGVCRGTGTPKEEICDNGLDDDCDGIVDENCICIEGETQPCGSDVGACQKGTQTCLNGIWTECAGEIKPFPEICDNNLDDDCDGKVDLEDENCQIESCFDNIQNQGETGIDCGGPCPACPTCDDGIKNQDEENIDCGGPCPPCPSCFDGIKNQGEEGVDCGGPCESCAPTLEESDVDRDGLIYKEELKLGTDPNRADTDNDGILDSKDSLPLCPNNFCDIDFGETTENCPEDCKKEPVFPWLIILIIFFLLILAVGIYFYWKFKKATKIVEKKFGKREPKFLIPTKPKTRPAKQRKYKTEIEKKLEKTFEEAKKTFKK